MTIRSQPPIQSSNLQSHGFSAPLLPSQMTDQLSNRISRIESTLQGALQALTTEHMLTSLSQAVWNSLVLLPVVAILVPSKITAIAIAFLALASLQLVLLYVLYNSGSSEPSYPPSTVSLNGNHGSRSAVNAPVAAHPMPTTGATSAHQQHGSTSHHLAASILQPAQRSHSQGEESSLSEQEQGLIRAAIRGDTHSAEAILTEGTNEDIRSSEGLTPLMHAIQGEHLGFVRMLLSQRPQCSNQRGQSDLTALMLAVSYPMVSQQTSSNRLGTVASLIGKNADVHLKDSNGCTALMYAAREQGTSPQLLRTLITAQARVDDANNARQTALMLAAGQGSIEKVRVLLGAGANRDLVDSQGATALSLARANGHTRIVELLTGRELTTPRSTEALGSIVQPLINESADRNLIDSHGNTALSLTRNTGHGVTQRLTGEEQTTPASSWALRSLERSHSSELSSSVVTPGSIQQERQAASPEPGADSSHSSGSRRMSSAELRTLLFTEEDS